MEKRKCLTFLFCMILCYFLFQYTARAQSSSHSISSQGEITYSPLNVNLAVIPDDWSLTYGSGPQIIYLDYSVTHNGNPSIRLEPHTSNDVNTARECDGTWYNVKPGDHIVAKIWIKVDSLAGYTHDPNNVWSWKGARVGIDLYGSTSSGGRVLFSYPLSDDSIPYGAPNMYVEWNTPSWTQKTYDFIVPADYFTKDLYSGQTISPTQISSLVLWMQAVANNDPANAWFADAELYINP